MDNFVTAVIFGGMAGILLSVFGRHLALREAVGEIERAPVHLVVTAAGVVSGFAFPLLLKGSFPWWQGIILWGVATMFAAGDASLRIVPDTLTAVAFVAGVASWSIRGEPASALWGCLVSALVFLPGVLLHQMGAGDLKAAASLGAIAGWPLAAYGTMAGVLLGGIVAALLVLIGLFRRTPLQYLRRLTIPYVIPLSAGFVFAAIFVS